jgi:large subunit ribosomal protein L4
MAKLSVLNTKGEKVKDITLNAEVWGIVPNDAVLFDAIRLTRNSQRQGTHETKTRSEVSGGGRKPWRQKGTGRARQGSIRAVQWYHGGVAFGPHNRSYDIKMNRKERRLALKSALAYKAIESKMIVVDKLEVSTSKTKDMKAILKSLNAEKKVLIITDELTDNLILSSRNLKNVLLLSVDEVNTYDVVYADTLIITEAAVKSLEEVLA